MPKRPAKKPTRKSTRRKDMAGPALTAKQALFVDEYLVDLNGKQAAIRAGYSPRTAEVQASRLLRNAQVKARVQHGMAARNARVEVSQDEVLEELQQLAHSCVDDYVVDENGRLVPAEGRPQSVMKAVSSVKYKTRTYARAGGDTETVHEVEFRLWDKPNTLKLEGRHVGLFPNEVKLDLPDDSLAAILGRAAAQSR